MSGSQPTTLLKLDDVHVGYTRGIDILRRINLSAAPGEITTVIGPNGAGKSTLLKCVFGLLSGRGSVRLAGEDVGALSPSRRKELGIGYVPQHHSTCPHLTIEENLRLGGWLYRGDKKRLQARLDEIYGKFPVLAERRKVQATQLSGGQLRTLAVAKELIVPPKLLLVDEPSVGMSPNVARDLYNMLRGLPEAGVSILLVDQNIVDAIEISNRVYLVGEGTVQREGSGNWFAQNINDVIREMLQGTATGRGEY